MRFEKTQQHGHVLHGDLKALLVSQNLGIGLDSERLQHGLTHPIVMSKMLLPTELDTAMSPRPLRATITLVIRSGMEVPAARMVRPMISSEIPIVSPT